MRDLASAKSSDEAKLPAAALQAAIDRAREPLLECHRKGLFVNPNT